LSNTTSAPASPVPAVLNATPNATASPNQGVAASKSITGVSSVPSSVEDQNRTATAAAARVENVTSKERRSSLVTNTGSTVSAGSVPPSVPAAAAESSNATPGEDYVAARLIHSVKSVSPPEALRNYVTGNVKVDALVDSTGHVKSVTVLSGPRKLYS